MDIVLKGLIGGIVTALIVWASRRGDVLPGILPLAPTFAVIALVVVGSKASVDGFRTTCLAGAKTIPAYLVFLGTCYLLIGRVDYRVAIAGGLIAWVAAALVIFLGPRVLGLAT